MLVFVLEADTAFEQLSPQRVDALALLVHDVVVFEQVLADREVLGLDLLLRALDGPRHHAVFDGHALLHPEPLHQPEMRSDPKIRIRSSSSDK